MRTADMVMTAESGFASVLVGGHDALEELRDAVEEFRESGSMDGPRVRRLGD